MGRDAGSYYSARAGKESVECADAEGEEAGAEKSESGEDAESHEESEEVKMKLRSLHLSVTLSFGEKSAFTSNWQTIRYC